VNAKKKTLGRQIFVLTPEEKKTIAFVLCALVLGIATKNYRDTHAQPPHPLTSKEERTARKTAHLHHSSPSPTPIITSPADR
jgi:hypothetical protein